MEATVLDTGYGIKQLSNAIAKRLEENDYAFEVEKLNEACKTLAGAIADVISELVELMKDVIEVIDSVIKLPPKQRYKTIKSLGIKDYEPFFKRKGMYRCRNTC